MNAQKRANAEAADKQRLAEAEKKQVNVVAFAKFQEEQRKLDPNELFKRMLEDEATLIQISRMCVEAQKKEEVGKVQEDIEVEEGDEEMEGDEETKVRFHSAQYPPPSLI